MARFAHFSKINELRHSPKPSQPFAHTHIRKGRQHLSFHRLVNPLQLIEGDSHVVLAQAENAAHT
jgi:hypothetical protein